MNEITIGFVKQASLSGRVSSMTKNLFLDKGAVKAIKQRRVMDRGIGRSHGVGRAIDAERLRAASRFDRARNIGLGVGLAGVAGAAGAALASRKKEAGVVSSFARAGRRAEGQIVEVQRLRQKGVPFGDAMRRAARKGAKIKSMMSSGAGAAATHAPDTAARGKILARRTGHASAKETLTRRLSK